ncbi:MAG: lamin tail domain-containing protein, partial [Oligoflexia bacterium]|nr:lamin tail domain-containing protein [Oligoflexia bacterium]
DDIDTLQAYDGSDTVVGPGGYAVVLDSDYAGDYTTIPDGTVLLTTGDTRLGNGLTTSDEITLYESDGSTIASTYTHASDPGDGISMEMVDLATGDASGNWRASVCDGGSSPGSAECFPESGDPTGLVITEVLANAVHEASDEYVELYNPTDTEIDASGLIVEDGGGYSDRLVGFQSGSTLIGPGEHALILDEQYAYAYFLPGDITLLSAGTTIGNGLANATDTVSLYLSDGSTLVDSFSWPTATSDGVSIEKIDYAGGDVETNWQAGDAACDRGRTPGKLNAAAGGLCGPLVVTEVMANPLTESSGEFIELWNPSSQDLDLEGLIITDGDADDVLTSRGGDSTVIPAGGYALIVEDGYADDYTLDSSLVVVTTGDNTVGNALSVSDPVQLLEPDGTSVIANYLFPFNPGNGVSAEKIDPLDVSALDSADNWTASTCASGSSPGLENCSSSTSTSATTSDLDLVISEVMSNPLTESTGEFVELYNAGADSIDLLYFVIWDGDALDTIMGYSDIYDTVLDPGQYAVILDSGYAGEYTIPADALLLTTDDATVASGLAVDDPVYLYESGATALVDSYTFPFDAGNGTSVEKVDLAAGDLETNWIASSCGASPGDTNCL